MSEVYDRAKEAIRIARGAGLSIVTAESCTGGLLAAALTEITGASEAMDRGFVTYSNDAKHDLLGVPTSLLRKHGAVSEETALAMAEGALERAGTGVSVAITGIAGPGGGSAEKPVGLVHFAAARKGRPTLHREKRFGDIGRSEVRRKSVLVALELLAEAMGKEEVV